MAKRKQYMLTAEEALMTVYRAYFAEHGDIPSSPAVIKAARKNLEKGIIIILTTSMNWTK